MHIQDTIVCLQLKFGNDDLGMFIRCTLCTFSRFYFQQVLSLLSLFLDLMSKWPCGLWLQACWSWGTLSKVCMLLVPLFRKKCIKSWICSMEAKIYQSEQVKFSMSDWKLAPSRPLQYEEFEDTKGVIRICISK